MFLDTQKAYFWRLLILFYNNMVVSVVDYELYPYLSVQLVNVVGCAVLRQAALQSEHYFEPAPDTMKKDQLKLLQKQLKAPYRELLSLSFSRFVVHELLAKLPTGPPTSESAANSKQ